MIPRVWWATSGRLALEDDGTLWRRYRSGWEYLGDITEIDPPAGHEAAFEELFERFTEADDRDDLRREASATYRDGLKGGVR